MNIQETYKNLHNDTKVTIRNSARLVESAALLIVAFYNYTTAYHAPSISSLELRIRLAASVVIGLRGAYELLRHLANKEDR